MKPEERKKTVPRTVMIGGKAFVTDTNAKRIVKLVKDVGDLVNSDPEVNDYLKVVFVPNYNVSVAEMLIPGSKLKHINTAGMEASGTSNMKFSLNGCLIIGTLDGANVEIREEIGDGEFLSLWRHRRSGSTAAKRKRRWTDQACGQASCPLEDSVVSNDQRHESNQASRTARCCARRGLFVHDVV